MNKQVAIKVDNLTKIYKLYNSPLERLKEALHWRGKKYHQDFYALKDIDFTINKGETVGIIGKNGSGKSTLLKIITGVLTPTAGLVEVNGKIAALLELGAGFNPDYTGIENIYFQGNLMGYTNADIEKRLQQIIDFADIGDFIYQPVKVYSSGMFARLAFAVAINVEPDILIVDEALSVGDIQFQQKCIVKMEELKRNNVSIIFVSHDLQILNKFCDRIVWLRDGSKYQDSVPDSVINAYLAYYTYGLNYVKPKIHNQEVLDENTIADNYQRCLIDVANLPSFGNYKGRITGVGFINHNGEATNWLMQGEWVTFVAEIESYQDLYDVGIGVMLNNRLNVQVITFNSYMYDGTLRYMPAHTRYRFFIKFKVPKIFAAEYTVTVAMSTGTQLNHDQQHWIDVATVVNIMSYDHNEACYLTLYKDEIEYKYQQLQL
jgi:ABC-type polysaccharide/polyol phosphate transport system ATPase subunit